MIVLETIVLETSWLTWAFIKELFPWLLAILGTIIGLNKDWIANKFKKSKNTIEIKADIEQLENAGLGNVEKSLQIFKDMLDTNTLHYQNRIKELEDTFESTLSKLKAEIVELQELVQSQKVFIAKQSKSLDYYERKYGRRTDN